MTTDSDQTKRKQRLDEEEPINFPAVCVSTADESHQPHALQNTEVILRSDQTDVKTIHPSELHRLTLRVQELENVVERQNRIVLNQETKDRNHSACLDELVRYKTECAVLERDRDKQYNEKLFYQLQAEELSSENCKLHERLHGRNIQLLEADRINKQQRSRIHELEKQVQLLNERLLSGSNDPQNTELLNDQFVEGNSAGSRAESPPKRRRYFETSRCEHPVCKNCNTVFSNLNPGDVECSFHLASPQPYQISRLKNELEISKRKLDSAISDNVRDGKQLAASNAAVDVAVRKKRKCTFYTTTTSLPYCTYCMTVFDKLKPHEVECRFHRYAPQPVKSWCKHEPLDLEGSVDKQRYKYWPCCDKTSVIEPPGCLKLRGHNLVKPDPEVSS